MKFDPCGPITRSVEFRATAPDDEPSDGRTLEGYAAVFDQPTEINSWEGHFNERVAPGAFKKSLRNKTPVIQFDHGQDPRTGTVPIAQLTDAHEDEHGLKVKARMYDNPVVEPIRQAIAGKSIRGMSFRFTPTRDRWTDAQGNDVDPNELESLLYGGRSSDRDRLPLNRVIQELKLHEMGPVVNPAYEGTSVGMRSADDMTEHDREALVSQYKRTMERSGAVDGDSDEDDTLAFDHFASDVPVRDDGMPDIAEDDERAAKDPKKPYGDVKYADPGYQDDGKNRYPLDTAEHVKAAWSYINMPKNAEKYSSGDLAKVKAAIKAAAPKFGIDISEDDDKNDDKSEKKSSSIPTPVRNEDEAEQDPSNANPTQRAGQDTNPRKVVTLKTKEEINARLDEIRARQHEMAEETRDAVLDEEQTHEWDSLRDEATGLEHDLDSINERMEMLRKTAAGSPDKRERGSGPAFHRDVDPYDIDALKRDYEPGSRTFERKLVENAERAIEKAKFIKPARNYKGAQPGDVATELLETIDKPSVLAARMVATGSKEYEEAFGHFLSAGSVDPLSIEERRALSRAQELGTDTAGGYAVPFQLDPTVILTNAGVENHIREVARIEKITGKVWEGVTSAGVTVVRGAEGATAPDNTFTLGQPTLSTNRVQGFVPFTYEIEMSWGALRSEITALLVDAKAREEDSFITGDGTGTNPFGLIGWSNSSALPITKTDTTGAFAADDVYNTYDNLPVRWERNAVWMGHKAIYNKIRQFDTAGGAQLWARIGDGQPNELMDYASYRSSGMDSTIATGNNILVLGDFSQFLIVDRLGMNVEMIPQIFDSANGNRPTGQRGVYAVWMNNAKRLVDDAFQVLQVK